MEVEDEDEGKEHVNGAEPLEDPVNLQGTPDTDRAKEFAKLCISDHPFKEEPGVGSRGTSPRPREGDGGSSREVSYRHPGGGEGGKQPLSVLSTTDSKLLREPREHRHRRYHSGYKSRYSRDISITQMALAEDDNISALQQVTKGGAAAVTLASKWQVSFDDSEETDNEVEAKDNLTSPEHRPLIAQDSPSKLSHAGPSFWPNSGASNKSGPNHNPQMQILTLALRERERIKRLEKQAGIYQTSNTEMELHRYMASLNKAFGDLEDKWRKSGIINRLYPKELLNTTRTWSCPNLSPGIQVLPVKYSSSDTNLQELQRSEERIPEKRNVPSRRHSADVQASSGIVGDFKRWSMGSTFEKITKKLPKKEDVHLKSNEEAHNEGIKSAPIPSSVKPKSILRKSGSDQPLVQNNHRNESSEKVFNNKLVVTTIEWESNDKIGNVVKHEVESPTLERQSPATPLADIARLHLEEPSVYFDAPQPNEEDSDDARRNGGADDEEFDTPPKDDVHSTSNISETRYDEALQYRKRSPTPPNRSGIMYSSGMRRKLKDVDFHVAEAVIEEDKEGGSASDCQSPRRQDSVTQTRPQTDPPFSRSGSNSDDFIRSTIPVHMMDTCREPTPETDSDSWRVPKTGSEESIRPPYMLKPYNRRRPRSMIEGNPRLAYPRDGNRSPNGKYTVDFTAKPYRAGDKSPRTTTPMLPTRSGVKQKTPPVTSDLANDQSGVQSSRSASSSREESDYVEANNRMPLTQKRSDFFTRSISWDAKFRKERSPNSRKTTEDKYVRADMNDWRGRYSRRRQRAVMSGSSESRIPRPKGRLRVAESEEPVPNDFQQPEQRCLGSVRSGEQQVKSPVSSSLPTLQNERVPQTEVHRSCKSEVMIPRFRPESGGSAYVQPREICSTFQEKTLSPSDTKGFTNDRK
ncbi:uncharacterized protein TNCT_557232 [Trichonephila clavata]|uniref:Uncharacterized protein n=1 Tax=Trichonephila clavata TaxID=2740835 RepID=A0A8X6KPK3_TRICU|nr:uncharacterized protein TNCT_557232 [Trichonephila clavata]